MNQDHPIVRQAWNVVWHREMAWQQAQAWDAVVAEIEGLQPGDPTGEEVLARAASLLQSITSNFGPRHGWTLAQHHLIYQHAKRVLGPNQTRFNRAHWTER